MKKNCRPRRREPRAFFLLTTESVRNEIKGGSGKGSFFMYADYFLNTFIIFHFVCFVFCKPTEKRVLLWILSLVITVVPIIWDYGIRLSAKEYIQHIVFPGYANIILFLFVKKIYEKWLENFREKCLENGFFRDDGKTAFYFWASWGNGRNFFQLLWLILFVCSLSVSGYRGYQRYTENQQQTYFETFSEKEKLAFCKKWLDSSNEELYLNCRCAEITGKDFH